MNPFLIAAREGLECSLVVLIVLSLPGEGPARKNEFLAGFFLSMVSGLAAGFIPYVGNILVAAGLPDPSDQEVWTRLRYVAESLVFYSGLVLLKYSGKGGPLFSRAGYFSFGFLVFFFEARSLGFLVHDLGTMKEAVSGTAALAALGLALGLTPILFARWILGKIPLGRAFTVPSAVMAAGALMVAFGGVREIDGVGMLPALQKGLVTFLEGSFSGLASALMIDAHEFLSTPFSGLLAYLSGDRTATALAIIFAVFPPLYILADIYSRPDPPVEGISVKARRRLKVSFFRKELMHQSYPVVAVFVLLMLSIHLSNVSLNPMYEPAPMPVSAEGDSLLIPLSSRTGGDITDGKLRKYVYYNGDRLIIFLALLKPDKTLGVALDECEICKPADWNKAAQGYAQRGTTVVCKYCMTPIPSNTVKSPGGCNPIPVPFKADDKYLIINVGDLTDVFDKAKSMEKKGTHF